ncbi:hypothetical protein ACWEPC_56030 [Nonomuraea sp. NPDC004297]
MQSDSRPTGRKRNPIIEETRRKQIIDAAIETVATLGYANVEFTGFDPHVIAVTAGQAIIGALGRWALDPRPRPRRPTPPS